jgi:hypothetical protein
VANTSITVPGQGIKAMFLEDPQAFPNVPLPFQGVMQVSASTSISLVGLRIRYNERDEFLMTTVPATNEAISTTTAESDFPHIVNGGGFTTEFILFSGLEGQTSAGNLTFVKQDGSSFNLNVN